MRSGAYLAVLLAVAAIVKIPDCSTENGDAVYGWRRGRWQVDKLTLSFAGVVQLRCSAVLCVKCGVGYFL